MEKPLPAYKGDGPYAFISYSHIDERAVFDEIRWLQDQGINVWYEERANSSLSPMHRDALVPLYAELGRPDQALDRTRVLEMQTSMPQLDAIAETYLLLGRLDDALPWIMRAIDARLFLLDSLRSDPRFDSARTDSRWTTVVDYLEAQEVTDVQS